MAEKLRSWRKPGNGTKQEKRKDGETEKEARTGVEVSLAEVGEK